MYMSICLCVCACVFQSHTYTHTHTHTHTHMHMHMHTHTHVDTLGAAVPSLCVKSPQPLLCSSALLRFEYTLNGFSVFVNDEGTRTFLSLDVLSGKKEVWTRTVTWSIIAG